MILSAGCVEDVNHSMRVSSHTAWCLLIDATSSYVDGKKLEGPELRLSSKSLRNKTPISRVSWPQNEKSRTRLGEHCRSL